MKSAERGITLIHCLIAMATIFILAQASFWGLVTFREVSLQSHWGRTADAIADGALEMALQHLGEDANEKVLVQDLSTGLATAEIEPGDSTGEFRVTYSGEVSTERKIRALRIYEASVSITEGETPRIRSVARVEASRAR